MLYDILPIIVIVVSLGGIIFILMKKMRRAAGIDVEKIPAEVQNKVKKELIEKKIERKMDDFGAKFKPLGEGMGQVFEKSFDRFKKAISSWESEYKKKSKQTIKEEGGTLDKEIIFLLEEADSLAREERWELAEKKYLEAISLDERNIVAYAGLGEIYYKEKELEGAREAMEYVFKLAENGYGEVEASDFRLLGLIYEELGDYKKAFARVKKASEMEPRNPKNLDLLCKISIMVKNKEEAVKACEELAKVDAGNKKVGEYRLEIETL